MLRRTELKRKTPMNRVSKKKLSQGSPRWNGAMGPSVKPRKRFKSKSKPLSPINKAYREAFPECEITRLLAANGVRLPDGRCQVHHIQWGHSRRADVWANLITLSKPAHDWCHANPAEGRIICLYAKLRKHELKWEVLDELYTGKALTPRSYRDYISTLKPKVAWIVPLWAALVKGVE